MKQGMRSGLLAGMVGTVALNIATYADMALRGRPSSDAPSQLVQTTAEKVGLNLAPQEGGNRSETGQHRASGIGALLGYVNGLGIGSLYGWLRPYLPARSTPLAALAVGAAAMAASDVPLALSHVSEPKTWGPSGWAADIIPHLIYGSLTVLAYEILSNTQED